MLEIGYYQQNSIYSGFNVFNLFKNSWYAARILEIPTPGFVYARISDDDLNDIFRQFPPFLRSPRVSTFEYDLAEWAITEQMDKLYPDGDFDLVYYIYAQLLFMYAQLDLFNKFQTVYKKMENAVPPTIGGVEGTNKYYEQLEHYFVPRKGYFDVYTVDDDEHVGTCLYLGGDVTYFEKKKTEDVNVVTEEPVEMKPLSALDRLLEQYLDKASESRGSVAEDCQQVIEASEHCNCANTRTIWTLRGDPIILHHDQDQLEDQKLSDVQDIPITVQEDSIIKDHKIPSLMILNNYYWFLVVNISSWIAAFYCRLILHTAVMYRFNLLNQSTISSGIPSGLIVKMYPP